MSISSDVEVPREHFRQQMLFQATKSALGTRHKHPRQDAYQHHTFQKHQSLANHVVPVDHYHATLRSQVKSGVM